MKFGINDKVKIPKQKTVGDSYYDFLTNVRDNWKYLVVNSTSYWTIGVEGPNKEHISSNCFNPEDLEPYVEPVEFGVGDEVECLGYRYPTTHPAGSKGVVVKISEIGIIYVKANDTTNGYFDIGKDDLKLIKKANMSFKIGDEVEFFQKTQGSSFTTDLAVNYKAKITEFSSVINSVKLSSNLYASWVSVEDIRLVEEKKLIGYKAPKVLYGGSVPLGTIYIKPTEGHSWYVPEQFKDKYTSGHQMVPGEIVETWEPVYEDPKPKEITITLAYENTKVVVIKDKISVNGGKEIFTKESLTFIRQVFGNWSTRLGNNKHKVSVETVKIGCTIITALEFEQIEKAWKTLN